jgi:hypothetical protein
MNNCRSLVWSEFDSIEARAAEYLENSQASSEKEAFEKNGFPVTLARPRQGPRL